MRFMWSFAWVPRCEIRPDEVEGSPYSPPAVWKVSRQRPMLGRSTSCTICQTSRQVEACVAQHLIGEGVSGLDLQMMDGWMVGWDGREGARCELPILVRKTIIMLSEQISQFPQISRQNLEI